MSSPFVSICIPAYRRPHHFQRLLSSIAAQTFKDLEIIITDDSPGTEVEAVIKKFPGLPVQYYKNERQIGSPGNWNQAIKRSNAHWIQLLHSDDWYAFPHSLEQFAELAKIPGKNFIFSSSKEINEVTGKIKLMRMDEKTRSTLKDPLILLYENLIGHPSVVMHRRDPEIAYDTSFRWVVDIDFYIRYLQKHDGWQFIDEPLINIGVDETMISHTSYKNPQVEIPEYLGLLAKFPGAIANAYAFYCLWKLVKKFRLRKDSDLQTFGYHNNKPVGMDFIIDYQERIPRLILKQTQPSNYFMKRCYDLFIKQLRSSSS